MSKVDITSRDTLRTIKEAVDETVELIKPTFGPASHKVIISRMTHGMVVDDGVQIARDLELPDPTKNAVMKVVREVAIRTNDRVGDGTTGALIILQAIMDEYVRQTKKHGRKVEKEMRKAFDEAKEQIEKMSKKVTTQEDLERVARVSFDDKDISKLIAEAWYKLGVDGVLTVERSNAMETTLDITDGLHFNRGYISPYMVTNPSRMEAVIEKPYILFTDYRLTEINDVLKIMDKLVAENVRHLIIVAENIEQAALSTMIVNKNQGKFIAVGISAPTGKNKTQTLEDMALMTGGRLFSKDKGDKVDKAEIKDLGRAERFIATSHDSTIVEPSGDKEKIKQSIESLKTALDIVNPDNKKGKDEIKERLARLTNKIGVIKVGAATENEAQALKYKVEDAVHSTHAAYKGGVAPGGGTAFLNLKTSSDLLNIALKAPHRQLLINTGSEDIPKLAPQEAYNAVTGDIGPWYDVGVMDPVDVLVAQLDSAISIASLLITSTGIIVEKPQHIKEES